MINRVWLTTMAPAALVLSTVQVSFAQTTDLTVDFTVDFTVDVTSGPLAGERYTGVTSIHRPSPLEDNPLLRPPSITFNFGGIEFTQANDVRDIDANSPTANVQDGDFIGITYIVSRFGDRPTELPPINHVLVDGFAIENDEFGYVVGADFYQGVVNYALPPNADNLLDVQTVPEPSLWFGLATASYWLTRRWAKPTASRQNKPLTTAATIVKPG